MSGVATRTLPERAVNMPKSKPKPDAEKSHEGRAVNFRAPADLTELLDDVSDGLGLDVSNLVRMVLYEHLAEYKRRADQARENRRKNGHYDAP